MINRDRIGFCTTPSAVRADAWRVALFCKAVGETDPVYVDEAAARAAGHPGCPLPPTFLKAVEGEHFSSATLLDLLGVPLRRVLHAEQSFCHHSPAYVGEAVEVSRRIGDVLDKKDGALTFITFDTDYRVGDRPVASSRQTILVRNIRAT
jgi:MaoC dehydratase-like protein